MNTPLFESENFFLTAIDFDNDPEIDSKFTHDLTYARHWCPGFTKPLSKNEIKKRYEKVEKQSVEKGDVFHFAVRTKQEMNLIGFVRFAWVGWNHNIGWLRMGIGDPDWQGKCESELLDTALTFAFTELNLFRVEMDVPDFDTNLQTALLSAGFKHEITNREFLFLFNRYWDLHFYGILYPEWNRAINKLEEK